ncbi:uncharacterized protein LOC134279872 [Saccostrea cucullata]|uniref:uncharacterized protein LOC134279872 n=1 Tax=Saccostrea cuccullata TaxID=36930 RepID=UPI002ED0554A
MGTLKYQRGTLLPIEVFPSNTEMEVLKVATDKHHKNNKMLPTEEYILLYKDGSRACSIPGATNVFTVRGYKDFLGKPFQNMQLYICPKTEFESNVSNSSDSDDLPDPKLNNKNEVGDDSWEELGTPEILKRKRPATKSRNRAPERETQNIDSVNPAPKPENRVLDAETRVIKQENDRMEQPSTYRSLYTSNTLQ